MEYIYDKQVEPNLDNLQNDINLSSMTNKSIDYSRWDEKDSLLKIYFLESLNEEDKPILDQIVNEL